MCSAEPRGLCLCGSSSGVRLDSVAVLAVLPCSPRRVTTPLLLVVLTIVAFAQLAFAFLMASALLLGKPALFARTCCVGICRWELSLLPQIQTAPVTPFISCHCPTPRANEMRVERRLLIVEVYGAPIAIVPCASPWAFHCVAFDGSWPSWPRNVG